MSLLCAEKRANQPGPFAAYFDLSKVRAILVVKNRLV
jgi:hypothetical protein